MPPSDEGQLAQGEISILSKWIEDGAFWPEGEDSATVLHAEKKPGITFDPKLDWALLPRKKVSPPEVSETRWSKNPIDRFVQASRIKQNIDVNVRADRKTLIRRATFDLIGLPPTPQDIASFTNDPDDEATAFGKVIERLLASQQYGERQGRLWLDVARYADTQGDVGDYPIHTAYLYRNWVINALNSDLGFDDFLRAQLAGDILAVDEKDESRARGLTVATGFISLSRRFGNTKKDSMHLTIEDTLDTVGRGILGLTLRCARCHDHRFDPVSNKDYYALYGIFESTIYPWMGMSIEKSPSNLSPAIPSAEGRKKATEFWAKITRYEYQINNHFRPWLKPTLTEYKEVTDKLKHSENDATLLAQQKKLLEYKGGKFRELMLHGLTWLKAEKKRLGKEPGIELVFAVGEGKPSDTKLHRRGNPKNPGATIPRGFIKVIDTEERPKIKNNSGRLELANWITDPKHPLTARVLVNRIWQQHFGSGLVTTADNFGRRGTPPSHPELLDWLAEEFIANNWSLKKLHRLILGSETYQLASTGSQSADPGNVFLWKYARRRMDAEAIRDSMLAVSGQLDSTQPGAHKIAPWYEKRYGLNGPFNQEIETNHRSVYLLTQRIFSHSKLDLFDTPDRNSSVSQRSSSNVPSQALFLMNSSFVKTQAATLANRLREQSPDTDARMEQLFQLLYGRSVLAEERAEISKFLTNYKKEGDEWEGLCRTLLTSNEFFFID